jgi:hypothetical protein
MTHGPMAITSLPPSSLTWQDGPPVICAHTQTTHTAWGMREKNTRLVYTES